MKTQSKQKKIEVINENKSGFLKRLLKFNKSLFILMKKKEREHKLPKAGIKEYTSPATLQKF